MHRSYPDQRQLWTLGEYMEYDEKNYRLISQDSGRTFTIGDPMRVQVVRVDIEKSQIDFLPVR